jgi:hypothetical protein
MRYPVLAMAGALTLMSGGSARADVAPFACTAAAPSVCYFRIFYAPRGGRLITLPAGMAVRVPDLKIGRDTYCVGVNTKPAYRCARKAVNDKSNN